jgi:hypothetical protein
MGGGLIRWGLSVLGLMAFSPPAFSFGFLSEYLNSARSVQRISSFQPTDVIVHPRWILEQSVTLTLCAGRVPEENSSFAQAAIRSLAHAQTEIAADIARAASAWQSTLSRSPQFQAVQTSAACDPVVGGFDSVGAANSENRVSFTSTLDPGVLAVTHLQYQIIDNELRLVESDIEFNADYLFLTYDCLETAECAAPVGGFSFLGIMIHELGHALGISHTPLASATMFPSVSGRSSSRAIESLSFDDELAMLHLYPPEIFPPVGTGTLSGSVKRSVTGAGSRGAHVLVYNLDTDEPLTGVVSGMTGAFSESNGDFSISGLPLDTRLGLFVEPIHQPDVNPNLTYQSFNLPIYLALLSETTGLRSFYSEALGDLTPAAVTDFTLTSDASTRASLPFYISETQDTPNDLESLELEIPETSISNVRPLRITLSAATDLGLLDGASYSLEGTQGSVTRDWTSALETSDPSSTTYQICVNPSLLGSPSGTWDLDFTIDHPTYGAFTVNESVSFSTWTISDCATGIEIAPTGQSSSGGGGGCKQKAVDAGGSSTSLWVLIFILFGLLFKLRRNH